MRLLLDTHAFLWWVDGGTRLSRRARAAIADERNDCYLSVASAWEIAITQSLGRLRTPAPLSTFIAEQVAANGFRQLALDLDHLDPVVDLPFHHRDPFDRLLASQALREKLAIVSADKVFGKYGVTRVW